MVNTVAMSHRLVSGPETWGRSSGLLRVRLAVAAERSVPLNPTVRAWASSAKVMLLAGLVSWRPRQERSAPRAKVEKFWRVLSKRAMSLAVGAILPTQLAGSLRGRRLSAL